MSGAETHGRLGGVPGPVLVHGANGFIGSIVLARLLEAGIRATGTVSTGPGWRLEALGIAAVRRTATVTELRAVLDDIRPRTVLNLAAHGAYPDQTDTRRMTEVNLLQTETLAVWCADNEAVLVHAGSSSEYGENAGDADESTLPAPNSRYAITKLAATNLIAEMVRSRGLRATTLRLFSVYGPLEAPTRLIPTLVREGSAGRLPPFSPAAVSRDFVFIDDVVAAFAEAAVRLAADQVIPPIINISTGVGTRMNEVAHTAQRVFGIEAEPVFAAPLRDWDLTEWSGRNAVARASLGWRPNVSFDDGLMRTRDWYGRRSDGDELLRPAEREPRTTQPDVSAVVACYRDEEAIPEMVQRLRTTFDRIGVTFEILLVNNASPDDSLRIIEEQSARDGRVVGITHSRNFGSQSAFLSGMLFARGRHVVLLDGDLQDPPELIEDMWRLAAEGHDVVFGRRVDREEAWWLRQAYRTFYVVFQRFAPFHIPRDAGDFSLMSRRVVESIVRMPERGLFLRAQRAYAGFRQAGIDYVRPARPYGRSTNNLARNVGWATRGILAVSRAPLTALSVAATILLGLSTLAALFYAGYRISRPDLAPQGFTTLLIGVFLFGSLNFFGIAVVGEYVGRVLEEAKGRPRFIRSLVTESGQTRPFEGEGDNTP